MIADSSALKQVAAMMAVQATDRVQVEADGTGWHLKAYDPSHVSFSKVDLPAASFGDYEEWGTFGLDLAKMVKALADKGARPEISLADGVFLVKGNGMTTRVRLLEEAYLPGAVRTPSPECPANAVLSSSKLKLIIKALEGLDSVRITVGETGITIGGANEDNEGSTLVIPAEDCTAVDGTGSSAYPCEMFRAFVKALPADIDLDMGLGTDYPAVFGFTASGVACQWLVAPRIEED